MTTDTRDALLGRMAKKLQAMLDRGHMEWPPGEESAAHLMAEYYEALRTPRTEDARDAVVTAAWALDALMPTGDGLRYFHAGFEVKQLRAALAALTQPEAK